MGNIAIFYFIAQVIERVLELLNWIAGFFLPAKEGEKNKQQEEIKMIVMWALACLMALGFCYYLDLHLMRRLEVNVSPLVDKLLSAVVIGSGTKPIHDIISIFERTKRKSL